MEDIKSIVAKNITELRLLNNMTQMELAEKLNYSDKTISKWERAESTPDISVLVEIANLFGVTLDFLVKSENIEDAVARHKTEETKYNRRVIAYISESIGWLSAIFAFIITTLILRKTTFQWLYFVYALPVVLIVKLVFNSIWFNSRMNFVIVSLMMWSMLACLCLSLMTFGLGMWMILVPGIPGQVIIILWSMIKTKAREMEEKKK